MWCIILVVVGPRKFKHSAAHKIRHLFTFRKRAFRYGNTGLRIISPCFVDSTHFFRLRMLMGRSIRKSDKTQRSFWFMYFPHLPVTKRPQGARMGKGKGPRCAWRAHLKPGALFIETRNMRIGRSLFFFKQVSRRLSFSWTPAYRFPKRIQIPSSSFSSVRGSLFYV